MSENISNPMLRKVVRKVLPIGMRERLWPIVNDIRLARLRRRMYSVPPRTSGLERCFDYTVRINDGPNFYVLYNDIFVHGIYHFEAQRSDPLILDCGSNIGMSILYFKHIYPQARIVGFEPDPAIYTYLQENVDRNGLTHIQLARAAIAGEEGSVLFYSDGKYGSCLVEHLPDDIPEGWTEYEVPCVRLRDYLTEPVDFLKMNIEGAEWEVLADGADRLRQVREMVIEYHHLPGLQRTLHKILELLHMQSFEYAVGDFALQTYAGARPPVRLDSNSRYYRHVYARRMD